MTQTLIAMNQQRGEVVSVLDYGADPTGANDSTAAVDTAYDYARQTGGSLYFPPGTYLINNTFHGDALVYGAGPRRTVLKPHDNGEPCVELYGEDSGDADLGGKISNL